MEIVAFLLIRGLLLEERIYSLILFFRKATFYLQNKCCILSVQNVTELFRCITLIEMDTLSGEASMPKLFGLRSEKGSTLKGKNLLPTMGANSYLLK